MKKLIFLLCAVFLAANVSAQFAPINVRLIDPSTGLPVTSLAADGTVDTVAKTSGPSLKCYASSAAPTAVGANGRDQYVWCSTTGVLNVQFPSTPTVSLTGAIPAGTNNIGDVDVLTVPIDPFGANADAASATGSISAKLRFIAGTGIPVTSLPANASVNLNQVGSTAISTGVGAAGTGTARVVDVASGTTGSAVPTQASYVAARSTGNLTGLIQCDNRALINTATSGLAELVALTASQVIYVCGWDIMTSSTSAVNVNLSYGTGTACATGTTTLSEIVRFPASVTGLQGKASTGPFWKGLATAASNALCVNLSAAVQVDGVVYYTKF